MLKLVFILVGISQCLIFKNVDSLVVPDELPSLLSVIYSQIPPIKKGTDSRLGWGFRLGDHADFQVLVELGPQTNTRPLSNEGEKNNKRNAENNLRNTLYAQSQLLKQRNKQKQKISNTDGGKWIESWSNQMIPQTQPAIQIEQNEGEGEIDASLIMPKELTELYGMAQQVRYQNMQTKSLIESGKEGSQTQL